MKFPFMKAKPLEQYNHFPTQRMSTFTGQQAQTMWQLARYSVWIQLTFLFATPAASSFASYTVASGMANDPRTQGLVHALKGRGHGELSNTEWPQQPQSQSQSQHGGPDDSQYSERDIHADFKDLERASAKDTPSAEDSFYSGRASDTGTLDDSSMRDRESRQYGNYPPSPQQSSQIQSTSPTTSSDSDPFLYDDASPTAANDRDMGTSTRYNQSSSSGGSVWDRIRGGSRPSSNQSSQPTSYDTDPRRQRQESSRARESRASRLAEQEAETNETNAYSSEARIGAGIGREGRDRAQSQREFDDMLGRERRQSGSEDYDRGMAAVQSGQEDRAGDGMGAWERRRGGNQ